MTRPCLSLLLLFFLLLDNNKQHHSVASGFRPSLPPSRAFRPRVLTSTKKRRSLGRLNVGFVDEILDFLEGKGGYTGPTEQQLNGADDSELADLGSTFDEGPKNSTPAAISTGVIAFLVVTPVAAMTVFRFFNPDNIVTMNF